WTGWGWEDGPRRPGRVDDAAEEISRDSEGGLKSAPHMRAAGGTGIEEEGKERKGGEAGRKVGRGERGGEHGRSTRGG
ncbi:hypothetical protein, partial [Burkholderia pseudomallei]|uniref:hypothetical protein n=1 Tax=Burkholderia pseudomallei TaxID=28450 RepID=UPI0021F7BE91